MTDTPTQVLDEYKAADAKLRLLAQIELEVAESFKTELKQIEAIEKDMEELRAAMYADHGITKSAKTHESVLKSCRKQLFTLLKDEDDLPKEVTLVQQKSKLVPNTELADPLQAHKDDITLLLANEMYTSLSIVADADTLAWMRLRHKNNLPTLTSVVEQEQGYCRVKLTNENQS